MKKYIRCSRYIRASFDTSAPDWLRRNFGQLKSYLSKRRPKYKWDSMQFYTSNPDGAYTPIYLLKTGYGGTWEQLYIPGVNDSESTIINKRSRELGSLGKKLLNDIAEDVVYVDLGPDNISDRVHYQDPRNTYEGRYAGQTKSRTSNDWGQYRGRDKSGYEIPKPEDMLAKYYSKYPKAVFKKIDVLYQRIKDLRDEIFDLSVREDYLDGIGTELVERTPGPREIGYGDIGYFLNKLEGVIADYKRVLNQAALQNSSINTFERWDASGVYTEDQRKYNMENMGEYSQRLNADIKRVMRKIDDIEDEINNAKSW